MMAWYAGLAWCFIIGVIVLLAIGAAGAVEAILTWKGVSEGIVLPTSNYETPDPECDLDYVPNVARRAEVDAVLSNTFGFGGTNACLVFKRYVA